MVILDLQLQSIVDLKNQLHLLLPLLPLHPWSPPLLSLIPLQYWLRLMSSRLRLRVSKSCFPLFYLL